MEVSFATDTCRPSAMLKDTVSRRPLWMISLVLNKKLQRLGEVGLPILST